MALTRADTEKRQLTSSSNPRGLLGRSSSMNEIAATAAESSIAATGMNSAHGSQPMVEDKDAASAAAAATAALKQSEASLFEAQQKIAELTKENSSLSAFTSTYFHHRRYSFELRESVVCFLYFMIFLICVVHMHKCTYSIILPQSLNVLASSFLQARRWFARKWTSKTRPRPPKALICVRVRMT